MRKKTKFLSSLLALSCVFLVYLSVTSEVEKNEDNGLVLNASEEKLASIELSNRYKQNVGNVMSNFFDLKKEELRMEIVKEVKKNLLDLTLPAEFKNLHLNLVLALSRHEEYFVNNSETALREGRKILAESRANYVWLR